MKDKRFTEYWDTGKYKGFYQSKETEYKLAGRVHLIFTDGKKNFFASGIFKEAALEKIFDKIDKYDSKIKSE